MSQPRFPSAGDYVEAMQSPRACLSPADLRGGEAVMDPLGLSLENFDFVGRWRTVDEALIPIDASVVLADGTKLEGPAGLRNVLVSHPDRFVRTFTKKLLTYALGRGLEYYDMPVVRAIVRDAGRDNYRFSSIVIGIAKSAPFRMRKAGDNESLKSQVSSLK